MRRKGQKGIGEMNDDGKIRNEGGSWEKINNHQYNHDKDGVQYNRCWVGHSHEI